LPPTEQRFTIKGRCALCECDTEFQASFALASPNGPDGLRVPRWSDQLECRQCGLVSGQRAGLHFFLQNFRPAATDSVFVTEAATPTHGWLAKRFTNLTATEVSDLAQGSRRKGVRHEDLQSLSFGDQTFDFVLSFGVLDQVQHEVRAFQELFRCLKPGGSLVFTTSMATDAERNVRHAVLAGDAAEGADAAPSTLQTFGWELLSQLRRAGFEGVEARFYWSRALGYLGENEVLFTATRPRD
jgi:SAM-dependent methyltransferase